MFLLGSERSGTNLLRTLLGNHPKICAPVDPRFCNVFYENFNLYRPFEKNKDKLIDDMINYSNTEFNDWGLKISSKHLLKKNNPKDFLEALDLLFYEKSKKHGKSCYFAKGNNNHKYALGISRKFPDSKFLFLYRDPRDQISSWMKRPVRDETLYENAIRWREIQERCIKLKEFFGMKIKFVKYEDLISNPEKTIKDILKYLGLKFYPKCAETNKKNKESQKSPHWKNLKKPIMSSNKNKFVDLLTKREINIIESVNEDIMKTLGYQAITNRDWEKGNKINFKIAQEIERIKIKKRKKKMSKKSLEIIKDKENVSRNLFTKRKNEKNF